MPATVADDVHEAAWPQKAGSDPIHGTLRRGEPAFSSRGARFKARAAGRVKRALPFALATGLFLAAIACGEEVENRPGASPPATGSRTLVCPINDARFPEGQGVAIQGAQGVFEVCSKACQYQYELEPGAYPEAGR